MSGDIEFWATNMTKRDVALADLGIIIKKMTRVNLLKGWNLTIEQLEDSAKSGSLFKKRKMISVTRVVKKRKIDIISSSGEKNDDRPKIQANLLRPIRNSVNIVGDKKNFEEIRVEDDVNSESESESQDMFNMSDEQFAIEQADIDVMDRAPVLTTE